jgi:hypothetical protein
MRLTSQGLSAIDAGFLEGTPEQIGDNPSFASPIAGYESIVLDGLTDGLPAGELGPRDDPQIAMALHRRLEIRRGVATDARMWAWLAARHAPGLLRRRWSTGTRAPNRNRFVGSLTENGLARLWWAAELTREQGADNETHRSGLVTLLESQYRTDRLLSTPTLRQPTILLGVLDAIGGDLRWQVLNQICRRLGLMATTYAVYAMSRAQVRNLVGGLYEAILAGGDYADDDEPNA